MNHKYYTDAKCYEYTSDGDLSFSELGRISYFEHGVEDGVPGLLLF